MEEDFLSKLLYLIHIFFVSKSYGEIMDHPFPVFLNQEEYNHPYRLCQIDQAFWGQTTKYREEEGEQDIKEEIPDPVPDFF
jgi:hypothetical protein